MYEAASLNRFTDAQPWPTDVSGYAIGAITNFDFWWTDANSILHKAKCTICLMRAVAAISGAGIPLSRTYNATYGLGVTGTYAAQDVTNFGAITLAATSYAAGQGIWVQIAGPNYVAVAASAAIAAGAMVEHTGSGTSVKSVVSAPNTFAQNTIAIGGAGNLPIGSLILTNHWGVE